MKYKLPEENKKCKIFFDFVRGELDLRVYFVVFTIIFLIISVLKDNAREPYLEKLEEYQQNIKPEMIISILPDDVNTLKKPILDWKLDKLAFAMANAQRRGPGHPLGFGSLIVQMDTTRIVPYVRLQFAHESSIEFIIYFDLILMRNGKPYISETFVGMEESSEWAKSVGIADKEDWL